MKLQASDFHYNDQVQRRYAQHDKLQTLLLLRFTADTLVHSNSVLDIRGKAY